MQRATIVVWQHCRIVKKMCIRDRTYTLLKQTQLLTTNDGIAVIGVANQLSMRWMRGRLGSELVGYFAHFGHPVEAIQVVHLPSEQAETAA